MFVKSLMVPQLRNTEAFGIQELWNLIQNYSTVLVSNKRTLQFMTQSQDKVLGNTPKD